MKKNIFIKDFTKDETFRIEIIPNTLISELKKQIIKKSNFFTSLEDELYDFNLLHGDVELIENKDLNDYNINDEDTLVVFKKNNLFCKDHKGKEILGYCKKDKTLVCGRCLLTTHKNHDVLGLEEIIESIKEKINNFKEQDLSQIKVFKKKKNFFF
jgi:hypothetical protein